MNRNFIEGSESLEGEIKAAKDAIWRLTTRVFNLEKEVKDLKLVIKYTAKGLRPKPGMAKAAEMARLKRTTQMSKVPKGEKLDNQVILMPQDQVISVIKTEPMSEYATSGDEGFDNENNSEQKTSAIPYRVKKNTKKKGKPSADSYSGYNYGQRGNKTAGTGKISVSKKSTSGLGAGNGERRKSKGRSKSPTWEYFIVEDERRRNKDTLATCKTCNKNFAWPKIERLRKHVVACCRNTFSESNLVPLNVEEPISFEITQVVGSGGQSSNVCESVKIDEGGGDPLVNYYQIP